MSQPVGIIARIRIAPDAYKSYLRTKAVKQLASSMFYTIKHADDDFYIFRYNKKEETLSVFIFYQYGDAETLKGNDFESLKAIGPFLTPDSKGYLVGTRDSLNWDQADFVYAYTLENGTWKNHPNLDKATYDLLSDDVDRLLNDIDGSFADKIYSARIVDAPIVKKIETLKEKDRVDNLINKLDEATVVEPIYFFGDYYYNGICLYHSSEKALFEINPRTFVQKPYGGADDSHVVVEGVVLKTDPKKFKKLQKFGSEYYVSAEHVYNWKLEPIENADPVTFKLLAEEVAEDTSYVYFRGTQIPKSEAGDYRTQVVDINNTLLIGEKVVYYNWDKLEVDASAFQFIKKIDNLPYQEFALIGKDKEGEFLYHKKKETLQIVRGADIQKTVEQMSEKSRSEWEKSRKWDEENLVEKIESSDFEKQYAENPYSMDLLALVNNYFYECFRNWGKTKDKTELDKILRVYAIVRPSAWINPHLYHHLACVYAALGDISQAVATVRAAYVFGYEHMDKIWEDKNLKELRADATYQQLEQFYRMQVQQTDKLAISMEALTQLDTLSGKQVGDLSYFITSRFLIPDKLDVLVMAEANKGNKQYVPDFWTNYLRLLTDFFQKMFELPSIHSNLFYDKYPNYELIPAMAHFEAMKRNFAEAHIVGFSIQGCLNGLEKLKTALPRVEDEAEKQKMTETINKSEIMKILGEQI